MKEREVERKIKGNKKDMEKTEKVLKHGRALECKTSSPAGAYECCRVPARVPSPVRPLRPGPCPLSLGVGAGWPGGGEERSGSLRLPQSCSRVPGAAWPLAPSSEPPPAAPVPACPASEHVAGGTGPPLLALPLPAGSYFSCGISLCFSHLRPSGFLFF